MIFVANRISESKFCARKLAAWSIGIGELARERHYPKKVTPKSIKAWITECTEPFDELRALSLSKRLRPREGRRPQGVGCGSSDACQLRREIRCRLVQFRL